MVLILPSIWRRLEMLYYAIVFFVIALLAAVFGSAE